MESLPLIFSREAVERALAEDLPSGRDVTSEGLFPPEHRSRGVFLSKCKGILAGGPIIPLVYEVLGHPCKVESHVEEGGRLEPSVPFASVSGPTRILLAGERTSLNFVGRLSGIASLARCYVDAVSGTACRIADTRKTTPGLRALEKYAVRVGGAINHRPDLSSAAMVKDNHLKAVPDWSHVRHLKRALPHWMLLEIEVTTLDEARKALECGADVLLLDNMDLETTERIVEEMGSQVRLEASGGVTLETAASVGKTGVHVISVGALTHSAPSLDLSFELEACE